MTTPDTTRKTVLVIDDDPAVLGLRARSESF